jgi:hypothetical protein
VKPSEASFWFVIQRYRGSDDATFENDDFDAPNDVRLEGFVTFLFGLDGNASIAQTICRTPNVPAERLPCL